MDDSTLGALQRISAREVWASEPYNFTPWLRAHITLLGEALGLEVEPDVQQEVPVGLFSADLLGTDVGTRARILVENQLEQTDHTHLGQLITYASGLETDILVWVSTHIREEHRQALTWLNERTREEVSVFGVEIELLRIDESRPAPHFKVVVAPNEWQKSQRTVSGVEVGPANARQERYREFWRRLILRLKERDPSSTTASPERASTLNWFGISAGRAGFQDNLAFGYEGGNYVVRAELYIDVEDKEQNEAVFDALALEKDAIEAEFGEPLSWTRRDDIRASRIYVWRPGSIDVASDELDEFLEWGVERLLRIRLVFGPRVRALELPLQVLASDE